MDKGDKVISQLHPWDIELGTLEGGLVDNPFVEILDTDCKNALALFVKWWDDAVYSAVWKSIFSSTYFLSSLEVRCFRTSSWSREDAPVRFSQAIMLSSEVTPAARRAFKPVAMLIATFGSTLGPTAVVMIEVSVMIF